MHIEAEIEKKRDRHIFSISQGYKESTIENETLFESNAERSQTKVDETKRMIIFQSDTTEDSK